MTAFNGYHSPFTLYGNETRTKKKTEENYVGQEKHQLQHYYRKFMKQKQTKKKQYCFPDRIAVKSDARISYE